MILLDIENNNYSNNFIRWLINNIKVRVLSNINNPRFDLLNNSLLYNKQFKNVDIKTAILLGMNNIRFKYLKNRYIIYIDTNLVYPDTHIKISTLCKLSNYGTQSFKGYPLITYVCNDIKLNLNSYYRHYMQQFY